MTRRVGMLALAVALGAVPLPGCASLFGSRDDGPPRGAGPRPGWQEARPGLPPDWPIHDAPPLDPSIKQVRFPDGSREAPPEPPEDTPPSEKATAEAPKPPQKKADPPAEMPTFEIHTRQEDPLLAALRCYLDKHPAEAVELLKGYDKANQEALLLLLPLAVRLSEVPLGQLGPQEMTTLADQQHALAALLERRAPLRIERMCFCKRIERFGDYEPLPEGRAVFQAGAGNQTGELVQVYAELSNYASEAQGAYYVTRLASWCEIVDYEGKKVGGFPFDTKTDLSRSPRQDYCISYSFGVPAGLPPGHYTLWIYVKDVLAQPSRPPARRSLDFCVTAGEAARGSRGEPGLASSR